MAQALADGGALESLSNVLELFASDTAICRRALEAIESMCRLGSHSSVVVHDAEIVQLRAQLTDDAIKSCGENIKRCASTCLRDASACEAVCGVALAFAEFGDYDNIIFLVRDCEFVRALVDASTAHPNHEGVQRASSCALAAFASCDEGTKRVVESTGGMALIKRCVQELSLDDSVRLFPAVKRWISGKKSREDVEAASTRRRTTANDDDKDEDDGKDNDDDKDLTANL
jgi:hypothetical protein